MAMSVDEPTPNNTAMEKRALVKGRESAHGVFVHADRDHQPVDHGVEGKEHQRRHGGGDKTDKVMFQTFA